MELKYEFLMETEERRKNAYSSYSGEEKRKSNIQFMPKMSITEMNIGGVEFNFPHDTGKFLTAMQEFKNSIKKINSTTSFPKYLFAMARQFKENPPKEYKHYSMDINKEKNSHSGIKYDLLNDLQQLTISWENIFKNNSNGIKNDIVSFFKNSITPQDIQISFLTSSSRNIFNVVTDDHNFLSFTPFALQISNLPGINFVKIKEFYEDLCSNIVPKYLQKFENLDITMKIVSPETNKKMYEEYYKKSITDRFLRKKN